MWYAVSLFFKSIHTPAELEPVLWEESVRLIQAASEAQAREQAEKLGRSAEYSYEVEDGLVTWVFERVERVFSIDDEELRSGSEVFSRFMRDSEANSLSTPFD